MRFATKTGLTAGVIFVLFSSILTYAIYQKSAQTIEEALQEKLLDEIGSTLDSIDRLMAERESDTIVLAENPIVTSDQATIKEKTRQMEGYRDQYKSYVSISIFDTNQTRIADTSRIDIGKKNNNQHLKDALSGKVSAGKEISYSDTLGQNVIHFAAPIRNEKGNITGALVARVPLSKFQEMITSMKESVEEGILIDLIDDTGTILASNHRRKNILNLKHPSHNEIARRTAIGRSEGVIRINNAETSFIAYATEKGYLDFKGNRWKLIAQANQAAITRKTQPLTVYTIGILAAMTLIAAAAINYTTKKSFTKLDDIMRATEEIRQGNFKTRIHMARKDEFQELGQTINLMAEGLEKRKEEHQQLEKAKTEFLSITSHELRSPMTPIKAQLQMLKGGYFGKLNTRQEEATETVARNVDRLDRILLDFLEISRIEAARLRFNFTQVDMTSHLKELAREMENSIPDKKIRIKTDIGKLPVIETDPDRILQVVRNLLSNAIKFSNIGGEVVLTAEKDPAGIHISVEDHGVGIAKENQPRIFEPFYQEEHTLYRKYGGTGLGLAICKGIIHSQNGKIWFDSEKGKGSTFHIIIPTQPIKEIQPIKVLFSPTTQIEDQIKRLLINQLGPIGETEYERLRSRGLTPENLAGYMATLHRLKVTDIDMKEFKNRIDRLFESEKEDKEPRGKKR